MQVVFQLLGEAVGQARGAAHAHGKVFLPPDMRRAHARRIGLSEDRLADTCPVCIFEIHPDATYAGAKGLPIRFDDLNSDAREPATRSHHQSRLIVASLDDEMIHLSGKLAVCLVRSRLA